MNLIDQMRGAMANSPTPAPQLFAPAGMVESPLNTGVLGTYRGPGKERVLAALERAGIARVDDAAGVAANGFAAGGVATADGTRAMYLLPASARSNPVYGGLMAQRMGVQFADDVVGAGAGAAAAPAVGAIDDAIGGAVQVAGEVAGDAHTQQMQKFVEQSLEMLQGADDATRLATLSRAVDLRAVATGADDVERLLTRSLINGPLDESANALADAIADVSAKAGIGTDAAGTASKAAKVAGSVADDVVKLAPVLDDVVTKGAPLVDDVVRVATKVATSPGAASAIADATHGAGRLMGFHSAIAEALRVLPRI